MFVLVLLFVYVGTFSLVNAEISIPMPQDIRDAFEKDLSERQMDIIDNSLAEEVMSMKFRLKMLERMHADDIQLLTNRLEESEYMRSKEVEDFKNRLEAIENSHEKDVAILTNRLREVGINCTCTKEEAMKRNKDFEIHDFGESKNKRTTEERSKSISNTLNDNIQLRDRNLLIWKMSKVHQPHNKDPKDLKRSANLRLNQAKSTSSRTNQRVGAHLADPSSGHTISFSDIKTNIGNNEYHPTTGIFTCQKAGIYVFSWSIRIHDHNHGLDTTLVRNGDIVGISTAGGGDRDAWGFGSATVTLILNPGDEVWLRVSDHVPGATIDRLSMLTAFLVYAA